MGNWAEWLYHRTATRADVRRRNPRHRTATHAVTTFAVPLGVVVFGLALLAAKTASVVGATWFAAAAGAAVVLWRLPRAVARRVSQRRKRAAVAAVLSGGCVVVLVVMAAANPVASAAVLGFGVTWGCWCHLVGDGVTETAVPILALVKIRGQRWRRLHLLPRPLRFTTGSWVEHSVVLPIVAAVTVVSALYALPALPSAGGSLAWSVTVRLVGATAAPWFTAGVLLAGVGAAGVALWAADRVYEASKTEAVAR